MVDSEEKTQKMKRGGRYCAARGPYCTTCQNTSYSMGILMHQFFSDQDCARNGRSSSKDIDLTLNDPTTLHHMR